MTWTIEQAPSQEGRCVIVTGANVGIGYETALPLAGKGAEVILACRSSRRAEDARKRMLAQYPEAKVKFMEIDVSRLASVRRFAEEFLESYSRLDILINNAGIMMTPYELTEDGFERQLATNYIGHFLLTGLLLPLLEKTPYSRIISEASIAHKWGVLRLDDLHFTKGYQRRDAYGQSKLACLMFAFELHRRLSAANYQTMSVAAHPGVALTELIRHFPWIVKPLVAIFAQSARAGALPLLYAALGDDIKGGDYCGPDSKKEWRGKPVKVGSTKLSRERERAAALWEATEKMTGFKYPV